MNIYAGNLPHATTEDELRDLFTQFGEVSSARIIKDKFTGSSKGFGFVEMPNDDEAKEAMSNLDGSEIGGRRVRINEARPPENRPPRRNGNNRGGGGGGGRY